MVVEFSGDGRREKVATAVAAAFAARSLMEGGKMDALTLVLDDLIDLAVLIGVEHMNPSRRGEKS